MEGHQKELSLTWGFTSDREAACFGNCMPKCREKLFESEQSSACPLIDIHSTGWDGRNCMYTADVV